MRWPLLLVLIVMIPISIGLAVGDGGDEGRPADILVHRLAVPVRDHVALLGVSAAAQRLWCRKMHRPGAGELRWLDDRAGSSPTYSPCRRAAPRPERHAGDAESAYHVAGGRPAHYSLQTLAMCGPTAVLGPFSRQRLGIASRMRDGGSPCRAGRLSRFRSAWSGASAIVLTGAADHSWVAAVIHPLPRAGDHAFSGRVGTPLWLIGIGRPGRVSPASCDPLRFAATPSRCCFFFGGKLSVTRGGYALGL